MTNIRSREEAVVNALKQVTILDKDKKEHAVPVIFADEERLEASCAAQVIRDDVIRLPMIGVNTTAIARNHMMMDGVIYALYRQDMNQIIEKLFHIENDDQLFSKSDLRMSMSFGQFNLGDKDAQKMTGSKDKMAGMKVLTARFTIAVNN